MELREFAEQVLFATYAGGKTPRARRTSPMNVPVPRSSRPPRPAGRRSSSSNRTAAGKSEFPGLHRLEDQTERGKLLHFFANHELLATELMALVLLKFPDAPAAFRKGVLQTLKDEQEHTRLYLERMKACGVAARRFSGERLFLALRRADGKPD